MTVFACSRSDHVDGARGRALVVDDDQPFLALLRDVVRATRRLEPVVAARSGDMAVEVADRLHPDMVLMDVCQASMASEPPISSR